MLRMPNPGLVPTVTRVTPLAIKRKRRATRPAAQPDRYAGLRRMFSESWFPAELGRAFRPCPEELVLSSGWAQARRASCCRVLDLAAVILHRALGVSGAAIRKVPGVKVVIHKSA